MSHSSSGERHQMDSAKDIIAWFEENHSKELGNGNNYTTRK